MAAKLTITVPDWLDRICAWPMMVYRKHKYGYTFRRIDLGEGEWTILDQQDYYRLSNFKWYLRGQGKKFYAIRSVKYGPGKTKESRMHREIMNAPAGLLVDHKDGNSLDNRRDNLRLATHSQNACNSQINKTKSKSRFRGVCLEKRNGRWFSTIRTNGKRLWFGYFYNEIEAAKAYDAAARKYHGEFARLNFPEEAPVS